MSKEGVPVAEEGQPSDTPPARPQAESVPGERPRLADASREPGPRAVPNEEVFVAELRQNTDQVVVRTTHDKLVGHLQSFERGTYRKASQRLALAEFFGLVGICLASLLPLFTATFSPFGPFSPQALRTICGGGALLFGSWGLARLLHAVRLARRTSADHSGVRGTAEAIERDRDFPASS